MQKSQAEKIKNFIDYLNEGHGIPPFEYEIKGYIEDEYELLINVTTTAFAKEVNALAMVIDGCTYLCTRLKANSNGQIYWKIW